MTPLVATPAPILLPVMALVAWSLVMWLWTYVTRLPAMRKAEIKPDPNAPRGEQMSQLPPAVRFELFALSTLPLIAMTWNGVVAML